MGLLEQEVLIFLSAYLPTSSFKSAIRDARRRGLWKAKPWNSLRKVFLPVSLTCLALILLPSVIVSAGSLVGVVGSTSRQLLHVWTVRLGMALGLVLSGPLTVLFIRLPTYERELRDQAYLQASELQDYKDGSEAQNHSAEDGAAANEGQTSRVTATAQDPEEAAEAAEIEAHIALLLDVPPVDDEDDLTAADIAEVLRKQSWTGWEATREEAEDDVVGAGSGRAGLMKGYREVLRWRKARCKLEWEHLTALLGQELDADLDDCRGVVKDLATARRRLAIKEARLKDAEESWEGMQQGEFQELHQMMMEQEAPGLELA